MKNQTLLYAVKIGAEDWQEEIITTEAARIPAARQWAKQNGFDRFRVAHFDDAKPDFAKAVRV